MADMIKQSQQKEVAQTTEPEKPNKIIDKDEALRILAQQEIDRQKYT